MNNVTTRWARCLLFLLTVAVATGAFAEDACEPSRWGADDEIGNANLITAESVLAASQLVRTGKTYSLGHHHRRVDAGVSAARSHAAGGAAESTDGPRRLSERHL